MASQYEGLPIYKATTDLVVMLDRCVRGFPRYHKYTLGSRLREGSVELVLMVVRSNRREERSHWLPILCARIEEFKVLVNLGDLQ
jgi:hypothetical protein